MKANGLMGQMFDIHSSEICDDIVEMSEVSIESTRNLILQFWYQQVFTVYLVCCNLAEAGTHSINC